MKTKAGSILASLVGILTLVFSTSACGGGDTADPMDAFIGTWEVESMKGPDAMSEEDFQEIADQGEAILMTFNRDGTVSWDVRGDVSDGKWKASDAKSATVTIDDEAADVKIVNSKLELTIEGNTMVLTRSSKTSGGSAAGSSSDDTATDDMTSDPPESSADGDDVVVDDDYSGPAEFFVDYGVNFGDAFLSFTVLETGYDIDGDPYYLMGIGNTSAIPLVVTYEEGTFEIARAYIDPVFYDVVQPGEYLETKLVFSSAVSGRQADLGDLTLADLADVEGTIVALDEESGVVSQYKLYFPDANY